jgi:hypothetical protein
MFFCLSYYLSYACPIPSLFSRPASFFSYTRLVRLGKALGLPLDTAVLLFSYHTDQKKEEGVTHCNQRRYSS